MHSLRNPYICIRNRWFCWSSFISSLISSEKYKIPYVKQRFSNQKYTKPRTIPINPIIPLWICPKCITVPKNKKNNSVESRSGLELNAFLKESLHFDWHLMFYLRNSFLFARSHWKTFVKSTISTRFWLHFHRNHTCWYDLCAKTQGVVIIR